MGVEVTSDACEHPGASAEDPDEPETLRACGTPSRHSHSRPPAAYAYDLDATTVSWTGNPTQKIEKSRYMRLFSKNIRSIAQATLRRRRASPRPPSAVRSIKPAAGIGTGTALTVKSMSGLGPFPCIITFPNCTFSVSDMPAPSRKFLLFELDCLAAASVTMPAVSQNTRAPSTKKLLRFWEMVALDSTTFIVLALSFTNSKDRVAPGVLFAKSCWKL